MRKTDQARVVSTGDASDPRTAASDVAGSVDSPTPHSQLPWHKELMPLSLGSQVLELPCEPLDLGHALKEPVPGRTHSPGLTEAVLAGGSAGQWSLGVSAANAILAGCYGPSGEWRDKR